MKEMTALVTGALQEQAARLSNAVVYRLYAK